MPTKKRISVPGTLAHIMARGIDGRDIFIDDESREFFLTLLSQGLQSCSMKCYAWTLMDNHYHLVVRCGNIPLDKFMRPLHAKYAKYLNRRLERKGYLFQDRYKSILSQDQKYLEELIRYVHLNPLRAAMVESFDKLRHYPWSGHSVLLGTNTRVIRDESD